MSKRKKGDFGYLHYQAVKQGIITLLLVAVSVAVFGLGLLLFASAKNILTVVAVLGMLPAAKSIVSMIMYLKSEKNACSIFLKEQIEQIVKPSSNHLLGYDMYLTSYDKNFPIASCYVKKGCLVAVTENAKCDCKLAQKHIETYLSKNGIFDITVKVFDDATKFTERVMALSKEEGEPQDKELAAFALMKSISL